MPETIESPETFDATKIRITGTPPAACSSCFGQYPERLHVDFGAAFDGPVVYGKDGSTPQVVDDLVICDECLRAAAALLGLQSPGDMAARNEELNAHANELAEKLAGAMVYIRKMEDALKSRPEEAARPKPAPRKK